MKKIIIDIHNGVIQRVVVTEGTTIRVLKKETIAELSVEELIDLAERKMDERIIDGGLFGV